MGKALRFFEVGALGFSALAFFDALRAIRTPCMSAGDLFLRVPGSPRASSLAMVTLAAALAGSAFLPSNSSDEAPWTSKVLSWARTFSLAAVLAHAGFALVNAAQFYEGLHRGMFASSWPLPSSLLLAGYLVAHFVYMRRSTTPQSVYEAAAAHPEPVPCSQRGVWARALLARVGAPLGFGLFAAFAVMFHLHAFGLTNYARKADAALVLGAKVYASGRPSEALAERVDTAVSLYKQGLVQKLIMSGGIDPNGQSEPAAMRRRALDAGVPDEAIVIDEQGNNTRASIANTAAMMRSHELRKVLAVSHYHHLARVKLLASQAGLPCYTVPADEGDQLLRRTPFYVLRETAALAYYYAHG
ncbi:MAG: YdcF family protein [Polyangiaceae bacterium]